MNSRTLRHCVLPALLVVCAVTAVPTVASAASPCAGADLVPTAHNVAALHDATLCLVNVERTSRGLRALAVNGQLRRAAQGHSAQMVQASFFDHVSPSGSTLLNRVRRGTAYLRGARDYSLGENIAWGSGHFATPTSTVQRWMESAGHRVNMLNRRYRHIGVGIAIGAPDEGGDGTAATYTTDFGYRAAR